LHFQAVGLIITRESPCLSHFSDFNRLLLLLK
jgi:hypothetical protein